MAKKNNTTVTETVVKADDFSTWTREQLAERYDFNVAERKRLAAENAQLKVFYSAAASTKKEAKAQAQLAALQAKLAELQGVAAELPSEEIAAPVAENTELAM